MYNRVNTYKIIIISFILSYPDLYVSVTWRTSMLPQLYSVILQKTYGSVIFILLEWITFFLKKKKNIIIELGIMRFRLRTNKKSFVWLYKNKRTFSHFKKFIKINLRVLSDGYKTSLYTFSIYRCETAKPIN